jgi:hypothetical protein
VCRPFLGNLFEPWVRSLTLMVLVYGLIFASIVLEYTVIKLACIAAAVLFVGNYRTICQKIVLQDADAIISLLASCRIFGRVSMKIQGAGVVSKISLQKLGYTTQEMPFEIEFGSTRRRFTLIHFANSQYFALSEQVANDTPRATPIENRFTISYTLS